MANLLKKFQYTIEQDLQTLFGKKEENKNNPIERLNKYIKEAEKQTEETKVLLKRQALLKQQLEQELEDATNMLTKRRNQLELAKESGEDVLIIFASQEVDSYEMRKLTLEQSVNDATNELITLEQNYEKMKHQLKDMKIRQLQLMGRENATRAQFKMNSMIDANNEMNYDTLSHYIDTLSNKKPTIEMTNMEERLAQLERAKKESTVKQNDDSTEEQSN